MQQGPNHRSIFDDDDSGRRRILAHLNRTEGRHAFARDIVRGYRGRLRQRCGESHNDQLDVLGLVVTEIVRRNVRSIDTVLDELRGGGQRVDDDVRVLSLPAMNSSTSSGDADSAYPSHRPMNFTRCAIRTAKTQRPSPRRTRSFHCHSDHVLFRRGGQLSNDVAEAPVPRAQCRGLSAEASVAEVSDEVAALQPRLHCDEESGRIRTVDDAVIVREREVHH